LNTRGEPTLSAIDNINIMNIYKVVQGILKLGITIFALIAFNIGINSVGQEIVDSQVAELLQQSTATGQYLKVVSEKDNGSTYDIGMIEPTLLSFASKIPVAVNVTLFRPYLWESRKPIMLFSAMESTTIFLLFLYVLFKSRVYKFILLILQNSFITFCFIYTIVFATFVGISSFNFGTLVRYKIPCMPFFLIMFFLILAECKKDKLSFSKSL